MLLNGFKESADDIRQTDNIHMVASFPTTDRSSAFSPIFVITLAPEKGDLNLVGLRVTNKNNITNRITFGIYESFMLASHILGLKGSMTLIWRGLLSLNIFPLLEKKFKDKVDEIYNQEEYVTISADEVGTNIFEGMQYFELPRALAIIVFQDYEGYKIKDIHNEYKRNIILMSYLFLNFDRRKLFAMHLLYSLQYGNLKDFEYMGLLWEIGRLNKLKLSKYEIDFSKGLKVEIAMDYIEQLKYPKGVKELSYDKKLEKYDGGYNSLIVRHENAFKQIIKSCGEGNRELEDFEEKDEFYKFVVNEDKNALELSKKSEFTQFVKNFNKEMSDEEIRYRLSKITKKRKEAKSLKGKRLKKFLKFINGWLRDTILQQRGSQSQFGELEPDGYNIDTEDEGSSDDPDENQNSNRLLNNNPEENEGEREDDQQQNEEENKLEGKNQDSEKQEDSTAPETQPKNNDKEGNDESAEDSEENEEEIVEKEKPKPKRPQRKCRSKAKGSKTSNKGKFT